MTLKFKTLCYLLSVLWALCLSSLALGAFTIVADSRPLCTVVIPENPSINEGYALEELEHFIQKLTGVQLEHRHDSESLPAGNVILIGASDSNRYIAELYNRGILSRTKQLSEEGFMIRAVNNGSQDFLVVEAGQGRGIIYGVYALVENAIEKITGLTPADLDFYIKQVNTLDVEIQNLRSEPFYPVRCALSQEDPEWLSRHRVNLSGAEGVWSGTGIDDGLGTAFKYVYDSQFDDMQDESYSRRLKRVVELQVRLRELKEKGIDSYLFMYIMGEPTKAMMENHPELLEDKVQYKNSRNGAWYSPVSWTKPEVRAVMKELVKSIVKTYSPLLSGFHLRSWGGETRAPAGKGVDQQELLWEIYFDIIEAAREVDPNFKLLISGYDQYWLKDPDRAYAAGLPQGTIIMWKWGLDGEPTSDPGIPFEFINSIGSLGHKVLVLSHDVEEVMPLWMVEADMFVEGVRKYADNQSIKGLGGFTLQGETGLAHLDKIVSARIGWNPYEDHVALMGNYLISFYGLPSAPHILKALQLNSQTLADYFSDFAGSLSFSGKYGDGSRGYATRFWNIIGPEAIKDTLSIPDLSTARYARKRFTSLLPRQQIAANEMAAARDIAKPASNEAGWDYMDGLHLMKMWVRFFESRLRLAEALESGLQGSSREQVTQRIASAIEYSREMQMEIAEIRSFVHVFGYDDRSAKDSLITAIDAEIEFLKKFDPSKIIIIPEQEQETGTASLAITELISYPNPMRNKGTFCYQLTSRADEVKITIYTLRGRQVKNIVGASARAGYNEEIWMADDDDGRRLASGTYIYKMVAERDEKKVQAIGKLSIIR